ncbi:hypothetical protein O181_057453 [Austropuccinia psidii MF-1]|uniref:Uncharacterized protein n=1 Tax=Austropuccinia psidii MF-1 TaxID=1389203 RepID=A0A9Q3EF12_9BASI|nr:hypothetical protein [Austropuccinia psidii MF-1]
MYKNLVHGITLPYLMIAISNKVPLLREHIGLQTGSVLRNLGIPRDQPKDREGLFRTRRPGGGHLGHSGGWQEIEGNHTHSAIHFAIQQKPQTRGLEGYGSSSSAPPTPQRSSPIEHGQKAVQPRIPLGRTWRNLPE